MKEVARSFDVRQGGSQVGVVTFSHIAELSIKLNEHKDLKSFNDAVDDIKIIGSYTRTDLALRTAEEQMFTQKNGTRSGIPKVLIVLVDGSQTKRADFEDPADVAEEMRQKGIKIIVVGMGKQVKEKDLRKIAGKKSNLFIAKSFSDLLKKDFVKKVQKKACKGEY